MKKEIWIQIESYRPNSNAPANRAYAFAKYFLANGYKVHVITIGKENKIENDNGVEIYRLKNRYHYKNQNLIYRLLANFSFLNKTKRVIKTRKKDIQNSFYLTSSPQLIPTKAGLLAKKYKAKLIFDIRDIWPEICIQMGAFTDKSFFAYYFKKCANKMYDKSDFIITVSNKKVDYIKQYRNGIYANKTYLVSNGVDLEDISKVLDNSIIKKVNPSNKKIVSYVGNLGYAQGVDSLIELAKNHTDLQFVICGSGKNMNNLVKHANSLKLGNLVFTGEVSKSQALAITKSSFISYISLQTKAMLDSIPTKIYDSLALGTPIFLVASGEVCNILKESRLGYYVEPGDSNNINQTFNEMIVDYNNLLKYKDYAINLTKEKYSRESACKALQSLLEKQSTL